MGSIGAAKAAIAKTVAVIGAGPAGLAAAKCVLIECGMMISSDLFQVSCGRESVLQDRSV
jgi:threonine dehydrogenase-like Zn-dependent dehydrogenase